MSLQAEALRASPWADLFQIEADTRMLMRLLRRRFGDVPESLPTTLRSLKVQDLEDLVDVCMDANSMDEFIASIPQVTDNN